MLVVPGASKGAPAPRILAPSRPVVFQPNAPIVPYGAPVVDQWGAVSFPAQPAPAISQFPGDPALDYTLDFLYAWLVQDSEANIPWQNAFGYPLIASPLSLFPHNPSEAVFNVSYLPALYLWRDDQQGGKYEYLGDDWLEEHSTWTMLWVLPQGGQENQKARTQYANQFVKAVVVGIERGYTPSWVLAGDPDPISAVRGSFLGYWTNLVRFFTSGWKRTKVRIQMGDGTPTQDFPAIEIKFEVRERQDRTIRRFPPTNYLDQRIYNQFGNLVDREIDT